MSITAKIHQALDIPDRLRVVASAYLMSLMRDVTRHTLSFASKISGLAVSQFSRFLSGHKELALDSLNRAGRRRLLRLVRTRRRLVSGTPWKVGIIIDATLHERSSRHLENAQRFNHGDGWVMGHQWTNIVLLVNGQTVPLAPLPFLTKKYSRTLGLKYKTEHERIVDFLAQWDWQKLLPGVEANEIVVFMDSGYDNKELQSFIAFQGWTFICSLKKTRGVRTATQDYQSIDDLFKRTRKIGQWQTIRTNGGNERKEFRIRTLTGELKGVPCEVRLVCSVKPNGGYLYLACSKENVSPGAIARGYKLRWQVEIFHRDIKSYLGFQDAGLESFQAMHAHVLWVYCAYLLLFELVEDAHSLLGCRRQVELQLQAEELGKLLKMNGRFDSQSAIAKHYSQVKHRLLAG